MALLRCDLDVKETVSVVLSVWKLVLGDYFQTTFGNALRDCGMTVYSGTIDHLIAYCNITLDTIAL